MRDVRFWLVEDKLREAKFFLNQMASSASSGNLFETRCYFGAFVSSCRSITFVLQKVMKGVTAFDEWYKAEQEKLAGHPFSNFFMTKRNRVVHEGETDINSGMMTLGKGGEIKFLHYFSGEPFLRDIDGSPLDVVTSSDVYLNLLTSIVKHCEERFRAEVDVTDMFTEQALMKHGLTVEDLEEMLGFPSGWTVGFPVEERLRILKKEFSR